jgi:hypothetical protein
MQLTKLDNKAILLAPQTAAEESFVYCLVGMIEAREAKFIEEHALMPQSLVQGSQPLTEGRQP